MISTILIATDGSEAAAHAERFGVALAARMKARAAGRLGGRGPLRARLRDDGLGVPPPLAGAASRSTCASAPRPPAARLAEARARGGRRVHGRDRLRGIADDQIVERGQQADLIVLGRDGQSRTTAAPR